MRALSLWWAVRAAVDGTGRRLIQGGSILIRSNRPAVRLLAATVGIALASAGLAVATSSSATAAPGDTVKVKVTKRNFVDMPTTLAPGVHRFAVRSVGGSAFQLVRPDAGYSKSQLLNDLDAGFENGDVRAFKRFERNLQLAGGVTADSGQKGVMWAKLKRGTYWALDTDPSNLRPSQILTVKVRGENQGGSLPEAATLTASGNAAWAPDPASIPASGKVTLRNESNANHFFGVARLKAGKTMADVDAFVEAITNGDNPGKSPIRFGVGFESGVVGPGQAMTMNYDLPAGEYVMVCFWPMPEHDFMPHMFMGMYRQLTVG
jgi:hypothetical protein